MKPDAANSLFPGTCAHMANVDFRYNDNVLHEPAISHGACMESGGGKGNIECKEALAHRAVTIAYLKAMVLFITNDMTWSKEIVVFALLLSGHWIQHFFSTKKWVK